MIVDYVENLPRYFGLQSPQGVQPLERIRAILKDPSQIDFSKKRIDLDAGLNLRPQEGELYGPEKGTLENHKRTWDMHVLLTGTEMIAWALDHSQFSQSGYDQEKDTGLFTLPQELIGLQRLVLFPRQFALIPPGVVHAARLKSYDTPLGIQKLVAKIDESNMII